MACSAELATAVFNGRGCQVHVSTILRFATSPMRSFSASIMVDELYQLYTFLMKNM